MIDEEEKSCAPVRFYINMFCFGLKTNQDKMQGSIVGIVLMIILSFIIFKLGYSTRSKIKRMKLIIPNEPVEEQTYCYLSVVIVNLVMLLDFVAILYAVLCIYMFAVGGSFSNEFLSHNIMNCKQTRHLRWTLWFQEVKPLMMFKYVLSMSLNIIFSNIVLVQIFEWSAMLYIIIT